MEINNAQMVGSGPFKWNEYVPGEYISVLRFDDWRWDIREASEPTTQGSTPGFELFATIAAITIGVILAKLRRK